MYGLGGNGLQMALGGKLVVQLGPGSDCVLLRTCWIHDLQGLHSNSFPGTI